MGSTLHSRSLAKRQIFRKLLQIGAMSNASSNSIDSLFGGRIEIGKKYPIRIADTTEKTLTMQFLFKPASIQLQTKGNIVLNDPPGSSEVLVNIESVDGVTESFKGTKRKAGTSDHEYVMVISTDGFHMHKVNEHVLNLRVQREENTAKLKESSTKESMVLLESRKLPKFLQKAQPKKKIVVAKEEVPEPVNACIEPNDVANLPLQLDEH